MTFDPYKALGYALMRANSFGGVVPHGVAFGFANSAEVDAGRSDHTAYDAERTCFTPTRSNFGSILSGVFSAGTWPAWTPVHPGSGSAAIGGGGDPDPNITSWLDMTTGFDVASGSLMAGAQRFMGYIPETFGVGVIVRLDRVGTYDADGLLVQIQTSSNHLLQVRFNDMRVDALVGGSWQTLASWGGDWWTEWWIECGYVGGGEYHVSAYAGTQKLGAGVTGTLPLGSSANTNLVDVLQLSGASNNRHSRCASINVGTTQLPDNMNLCTAKSTASGTPTVGNVVILTEDVSVDLIPNVNLQAFITNDDTGHWQQVTLTNAGTFEVGEIDNSKPMVFLTGSASYAGSGTGMRVVVKSFDGHLPAVQGIAHYWDVP